MSKVTYTPQGQVAAVTTSSGTTSYLYDASGTLLIQSDPSSTILYADGGTEEITLTGTTLSGLRLLSAPDGVTITESSSGTDTYELANQQGTASEDIAAATLAITRRYFDPWGNQVGTPPAWPDHNAFLGKPQDPNTSLDVLGARDYDPVTGSFTSLDPLLEVGSPQQMGGYVYAADNPINASDPSGQDPIASAIVSYLASHPTPANNSTLAAVNRASGGGGGGGGWGGGGWGGGGSSGWSTNLGNLANVHPAAPKPPPLRIVRPGALNANSSGAGFSLRNCVFTIMMCLGVAHGLGVAQGISDVRNPTSIGYEIPRQEAEPGPAAEENGTEAAVDAVAKGLADILKDLEFLFEGGLDPNQKALLPAPLLPELGPAPEPPAIGPAPEPPALPAPPERPALPPLLSGPLSPSS